MTDLVLLQKGMSAEFLRTGRGRDQRARLQDGLRSKGILGSNESLVGFVDSNPWRQGGAETYIADSIIYLQSTKDETRHVIAKALVSFGTQPDAQLRSWTKRRQLLCDLGIRVPRLFSAVEGTIYEEFIEDEVNSGLTRGPIIRELARIAAILDVSGFMTLGFLDDLRRREDKLYYVDFGSGLGEPGDEPTDRALKTLDKMLGEPYKSECRKWYTSFVDNANRTKETG